MNSKLEKALKIILFSIVGLLAIAIVVVYITNKDLALEWFETTKDFLNQPLPIVGITVGACLIFLWKLIITSNYGKKKIAIYDQKIEELDKAYQEFVDKANSKVAYLEQENKELTTKLANACKLSTNKKIKDYGKELDAYGKETIECETKAD